jgi:hypothetical protein
MTLHAPSALKNWFIVFVRSIRCRGIHTRTQKKYSIFLSKYVHQKRIVKVSYTNCLLTAYVCMYVCMMHRIKYIMCQGIHMM